jgi:hypothetical protein
MGASSSLSHFLQFDPQSISDKMDLPLLLEYLLRQPELNKWWWYLANDIAYVITIAAKSHFTRFP